MQLKPIRNTTRPGGALPILLTMVIFTVLVLGPAVPATARQRGFISDYAGVCDITADLNTVADGSYGNYAWSNTWGGIFCNAIQAKLKWKRNGVSYIDSDYKSGIGDVLLAQVNTYATFYYDYLYYSWHWARDVTGTSDFWYITCYCTNA